MKILGAFLNYMHARMFARDTVVYALMYVQDALGLVRNERGHN